MIWHSTVAKVRETRVGQHGWADRQTSQIYLNWVVRYLKRDGRRAAKEEKEEEEESEKSNRRIQMKQ